MKYLLVIYIDKDVISPYKEIRILNELELFTYIQEQFDDPESKDLFCVYELGKCVLDFS